MSKDIQEEIIVLFHAALVGRADIVQNAIAHIRQAGKLSDKEVAEVISTRRSEDQATPLHIATHHGHTDVIRSLLNGGADMSTAPKSGEYVGMRPYELAKDGTRATYHVYMFEQIAMDNGEALFRILMGGVPVDTVDDSVVADSTLHWAASFGGLKVATVLLANGCSVNITNGEDQTPLHLACKGKHYDLIKLLLDEGADTTKIDRAGKTPSQYLPTGSNPAIEELLLHPPTPSLKLHYQHEKVKEEIAAKQQLLLQQRLMHLQEERTAREPAAGAGDGDGLRSRTHSRSTDLGAEIDIERDTEAGIETEHSVEESPKELLLIFWPPVKRQVHKRGTPPLVLRNNANLLISVANNDIDMLPLLTWSGLLETMDGLGFQVQIKRSTSGSKIRVCIDKNICPVANSYELKVGSEQIFITAGDSAGLLYGVYTLIQLLKLHSDAVEDSAGVLNVAIPAISISDRPDVSQRAVLWSYRQQVRTSTARMQEQIELLSRLRMNTLFLVVDPLSTQKTTVTAGPNHHANDVTSTKVYALDELCKRHCVDMIPTLIIQSIHQRLPLDVLKNFSHSMISIVFVFDAHSIAAELAADAAAGAAGAESNGHAQVSSSSAVDVAAVHAACITACELVIKDAHLAGCHTLSLACSEWTRTTADPMSLAINAGLSAVERDFSVMYPSSLFTKPILGVQDFVQSIHTYSNKVDDVCSPLTVFPAFMDRDFMYPALLLKFYSFMFSGFAWNRNSLVDMLGDPTGAAFNPNIVREVMYLLMFPPKVELSHAAFSVMMDLMTGVTFAGEMNVAAESRHGQQDALPSPPRLSSGASTLLLNGAEASHSTLPRTSSEISLQAGESSLTNSPIVLRHELAKAEKLLWALLTAHDDTAPIAVPSKSEAATCLKLYRRVLHTAQWKPDMLIKPQAPQPRGLFSFVGLGGGSSFSRSMDDSNNDQDGSGIESTPSILLEVEELFCVINLLSALCKALVLAHKNHEKKTGISASAHGEDAVAVHSFEELFRTLSVGTKSDVANSILECLNSCAFLWRRRFDANLMTSFREANMLLTVKNVAAATPVTADGKTTVAEGTKGLVAHSIKEANKRFLLQDAPTVPACAVFKIATKHLPLPKPVHDFIQRLFTR